MKSSKTRPKGFTLVELLIVIIAALGALLMTVANRMRKSANQATWSGRPSAPPPLEDLQVSGFIEKRLAFDVQSLFVGEFKRA